MAIEGLNDVLRSEATHGTKVDVISTVEEYVNQTDWRVNANSNSGGAATHPALINTSAGKIIANYWLDKVYSKAEGDAHRNGDYHIHDLDNLSGYCCGHDLAKLLNEGFNGVVGRVGSKAPKHVREALNQMANYIGILQAEWAGAQAFSSFDTYLAPLAFFDKYYDDMSYDDLKKAIRNFVYNLNVPSRWGQSPFSNVTIDLKCPKDLRERTPMRDDNPFFVSVYNELKESIEKGKELYEVHGQKSISELSKLSDEDRRFMSVYDRWQKLMAEAQIRLNDYESDDETLCYSLTYKCFQKEMQEVMRAYYEVMSEGDAFGLPFTFPIPTVNITEDFDWENPAYDILWDNTAKYGCSYFQNFVGSQYLRDENGELTIRNENAYSPDDVRSMCPLTLDTLVEVLRNDTIKSVSMEEIDPETDMVIGSDGKPYHFTKTEVFTDKPIVKLHVHDNIDASSSIVKMSVDHLQPVCSPDGFIIKTAANLTVDDVLAGYNTSFKIEKIEHLDPEPCQCINVIGSTDNLFMLSNGMLTHNCRLQLDKREVKKRGGGLFGSDSQTGCYDDKTEVLTKQGWKFFKDLTKDDEFYTMNDKRGIEVHKANQLFVYDWDGDLCHFKNKTVDIMVTPNHNMLLTHNSNDKLRFKKAEECNHSFNMPLVGNWTGADVETHVIAASTQVHNNTKSYEDVIIDMDTWLKFLGLFLSEGSVRGSKGGDAKGSFRYEVAIVQKKESNIGIIDELMAKLPFKVNKRLYVDGNVQWVIGSKQLWEELSPLGCSWNKYIPEYVFDCSARQLRLLFDYMMIGDGHTRKSHKQATYYTTSKRLSDDFQHLLMLIGHGSSVKIDNRKRKKQLVDGRVINRVHTMYEIGVHYSKNRTITDGFVMKPYKGRVYCVEVPNHTLYVRRNGKCVWCGNSIGVVTINMARIGYNFKGDEKGYMKRLFKLMDYAKSTLEKKRKFIKEMVLRGLYPYTRRYITSAKDGFTTFFSTIGINGMNESIRNFTNDEHDITDEWGQQFAMRVCKAIRERLEQYQAETGNIYNLEATPAEGTTHRFAREDAKRYGSKEIHYIMCDKHGKVEVQVDEGVTEIECPLCAKEKE